MRDAKDQDFGERGEGGEGEEKRMGGKVVS
jgi:hypothetical protein